MRGRREVCAMLVKRGADPTITDDSGRIAADMTDDAELAAWLRYEPRLSPDSFSWLLCSLILFVYARCAGILKTLLRTAAAVLLPDVAMSNDTSQNDYRLHSYTI